MTHTNTEAVSDLLPCPFCGQDAAEFYERIELKRLCVGVKCGRCGNRTDVRDVNYNGHKNSAEWWNRRAANSAGRVEVKGLRETMWAEVIYEGEDNSFRFELNEEGNRDGPHYDRSIEFAADTFPVGTKIVVYEPNEAQS